MPNIHADPVVSYHLYGGPMAGHIIGMSGTPPYLRLPIPDTAYAPDPENHPEWSRLLQMATYERTSWSRADGTPYYRYIHEDIARMLVGR